MFFFGEETDVSNPQPSPFKNPPALAMEVAASSESSESAPPHSFSTYRGSTAPEFPKKVHQSSGGRCQKGSVIPKCKSGVSISCFYSQKKHKFRLHLYTPKKLTTGETSTHQHHQPKPPTFWRVFSPWVFPSLERKTRWKLFAAPEPLAPLVLPPAARRAPRREAGWGFGDGANLREVTVIKGNLGDHPKQWFQAAF